MFTIPYRDAGSQGRDFERSSLVAVISPSMNQAQLLSSFIGDIATGIPIKLAPALHCHSVWLSQIASRTEVSQTLLWAIRAISLSHLGRMIQDQNLIYNSRNMYGKALLKLNKALHDPVEGASSDTLSATVLLSFYEMLNCTETNSWVKHAGGTANLMRLRGPARHRTGFDGAVFMACRYSIALQTFHSRQGCFLNSPDWKQVSQEIHDSSPRTAFGDAREEYFQEFVGHPVYLTSAVDYMQAGGQDPATLREMVSQGHTHRSNLKTVWVRFVDTLRQTNQERTVTASASNDKLYPEVYQYPCIIIAHYYCGYYAMLTMINITLIGLEAKLWSLMSSPGNSPRNSEGPQTDQEIAISDTAKATMRNKRLQSDKRPYITRTMESLPDRDWSSAASPGRLDAPTTPASPRDYPTMSAQDTINRRNMYVAENIQNARETCKSAENVSKQVFLGPLYLVYALRTALRVLRDPEEKMWILKKLEDLSNALGLAQVEADVYRNEMGRSGSPKGKLSELRA